MYFRCMEWQAQILDLIHCALQHPNDLCEVIRHKNTSYQRLQWYDFLSFTVSSCYDIVCCVNHLGLMLEWNISRVLLQDHLHEVIIFESANLSTSSVLFFLSFTLSY